MDNELIICSMDGIRYLGGGCGSEGLMELVRRWGNVDGMESELDTDGLLVGKRYAMHFRIRHNVGRRSFGMCFFRFEQAKGQQFSPCFVTFDAHTKRRLIPKYHI